MAEHRSPTSQLGNLTNQIADTLKSAGSTQSESFRTCETGSSTPSPASSASETHTRSGEAGVVVKPIDSGVHQAQTVADTDNALLQSVRQLVGSPLEEVERTWIDEGHGWHRQVIGYRMTRPVSAECLQQARALIAEAAEPAERSEVVSMLAAVAEALPSQDSGDGEAWMELTLMAIEGWPADVIRESIMTIVKRAQWRPTPAEIRSECAAIGERRQALMNLTTRDEGWA